MKKTEAALQLATGSVRSWGELVGFGLIPKSLEKRAIQRKIVRENLLLALRGAESGTQEREELLKLYRESYEFTPYSMRPEFLESVYEATDRFGLIKRHGLAPMSEFKDVQLESGMMEAGEPAIRHSAYTRGIEYLYNLSDKTAGEHTKALTENTRALNKLAEKIPTRVFSSRSGPDE